MNKRKIYPDFVEDKNDILIQRVIENAFDFLETAIRQFKSSPKYSIINFCAAVELMLKARLMHEHWSLIVYDKSPDIKLFRNGNFKSIGFKDMIPRIESVTGDVIPKEITECFSRLANHRNKIIHFFHEAHSGEEAEKRQEKIAIEQCLGWYFLRKLLKEWNFIFSDYNQKIDSIGYKMKEHKVYIDTVFLRIKPEIHKKEEMGSTFKLCCHCQKKSSEEYKLTENLYEYKCKVCLLEENLIKIPCPEEDCKITVEINEFNLDEIKCISCGYQIDKSDLVDYLDTEDFVTKDNYLDHVQKNCVMCDGMGTVIQHHDYYLCTQCFFITKVLQYCGWCNEAQVGGDDLEMSYHTGCNFCEGHVGWTKDE